MQIGFIVLADRSEAVNGKLYSLGAGWNMLRFPELPAEFAFSIGLGIDVPWEETNTRQNLEVHIEGPDGERLGEAFSMEIEAGRPAGTIPGQEQRMVLALGSQARFERAGPHAVVLAVGGEPLGRTRFYVVDLRNQA